MERNKNPKSILRVFYLQMKNEYDVPQYGIPVCNRTVLDFWGHFTEKSLFLEEDEVYALWKKYPKAELVTLNVQDEIEVRKYSHHSGVEGRYGIVCEKCGIIADEHGRWDYQCSYYSEQ